MEQQNNCLALQALGSSVKSLLGPTPSIKCYISGESHDSGLLGDPLQIVEALTSSETGGGRYGHPINHLLYECCQGQQKECGCGVTTLVCLTSFWSEGILKLLNEDVPLPVVFTLFDEAVHLCSSLFSSLSISMDAIQHHLSKLSQGGPRNLSNSSPGQPFSPFKKGSSSDRYSKAMSFSRHFTSKNRSVEVERESSSQAGELQKQVIEFVGSRLSHGKDVAMQLAVKAVQHQCLQRLLQLDTSSILDHCVVGPPQNCSRIVGGVVVKLKEEMSCLLEEGKLRNGKRTQRLVVIEGDCTPSSTHPGLQKRAHVTSHDPLVLFEEKHSSRWLSQCAAVLDKLQVDVVVVGGAMSMLLWEQCLTMGILVVTDVRQKQLQAICRLSLATPTHYFQHTTEDHVGGGVVVEAAECGWERPQVIYSREKKRHSDHGFSCVIRSAVTSSTPPIVTALLCAKTEPCINILVHQFRNALHRLHCAVTEGCLLPGGGAFEATCVKILRQKADEVFSVNECFNPPHPTMTSWLSDLSLLKHWRPTVYRVFADGLFQYTANTVTNSNPGVTGYIATVEADKMVQESRVERVCIEDKVMDDGLSKKAAWRRSLELLKMAFLSVKVEQ